MLLSSVAARFGYHVTVLAVLGCIAHGCIEWDSLRGKSCGTQLVAQNDPCPEPEAVCGDGIVGTGEECDDANLIDSDECFSNCQSASCGDGVVWLELEDCDDGNREDGDGCSARCRIELDACGNGSVSGTEECDDGNTLAGDGCSDMCRLEPDPVSCGNGQLDDAEVCDDGNENSQDSCLQGCVWASCGDGIVRTGVEGCDDGNVDNDDGCTRSCIVCDGDNSIHRIGNSHCYSFFEGPVNFGTARRLCEESGAYLWSATSLGEAREVSRRLNIDIEVWLGSQTNNDDSFRWLSGETTNFDAFVAGQPRFAVSRCATHLYDRDADTTSWRSEICSEKRGYVCEREPALIDPVTHHAYQFVYNTRPWQDAVAYCENLGGYLAKVETQEEHELLTIKGRLTAWLGAQETEPGQFLWFDGTGLEYLGWANNQPSGGDSPPYCMALVNEIWDDRSCEQLNSFICEFD